MREGVEQPRAIVDITRLPLRRSRNCRTAACVSARWSGTAIWPSHASIRERFPLLSYAILNGASAQLRNMATTGGNLMQRTRCYYFYDTARTATSASRAAAATRWTASTGSTPSSALRSQCIATHPSDMCVALAALDATVNIEGPTGARVVPFADFHRLPGETPDIDTQSAAGELITSVDLRVPVPACALSTAKFAIAPATRSPSCRSQRRCGSRMARSATCVWRSAAWRTSRGAPSRGRARTARRRADA